MTREEAIEYLDGMKIVIPICNELKEFTDERNTAIDMAIEALKAPQTDLISRADAIEAVAQQWLFEASVGNPYVNDDDIGEYRKLAEELFEDVPSADAVPQSEQYKKGFEDAKRAYEIELARSTDAVQGEWIEKYNGNGWNDFLDYTCSNCGKKYERADAVLYHANYCPNCGARMKGGDTE